MTKRSRIISIILNSNVAVMELVVLILSLGNGLGQYKYYTQLSNVAGLLTCGIYAIYSIAALRGAAKVPKWVVIAKYAASSCLTVTFLVVIFVLIPSMVPQFGWASAISFMLVKGTMSLLHFICPVVSVVSFMFFEHDYVLKRKDILYAVAPTLLYGTVFIILNIVEVTSGPYFFLCVRDQSVLASVMWGSIVFAGAALIAVAVRAVNLATRRRKK